MTSVEIFGLTEREGEWGFEKVRTGEVVKCSIAGFYDSLGVSRVGFGDV